MIFVLKRKWDAEAVRMYQQEQQKRLEGLEKQLKEAIREAKKAEKEAKRVAITAKAEGKTQGKTQGKAEGLAEDLAEGEHKKAIETALSFKEMGLPVEQIAKGTGLSIEEIEKLK
ncbi:hypothetical protein GEO21_18800 [Sphingobacterium faecium]|uniref:hypothetical protein n=1 Tax=Sphingobacterium faecium TaxID=34087 RepID=UPI0012913D11|nr:hypothetical protein [Sphingobacterium faecium]MQP29544.1 hypothetical protein [Sphingobacterium faecium]